ncbi:MAG TPA: GNAT family N-acetyltransferase [Dongiaceae bacterium]|nr:GNAT family N-acetyltransferase [Dongiaceae bacterium]
MRRSPGTLRPVGLRTERLILRPWEAEDLDPFAALNADPDVTAFLGEPFTRSRSDEMAGRIRSHWEEHGFGLWAVELPGREPFIGFVGLSIPRFEAPFTPCVEVGWRLARAHWGRGYASEGARAALAFGFDTLKLKEIVSFTAVANARSRRVMERIGMRRSEGEDFDHPGLPAGHALRPHVLYRISQERWRSRAQAGEPGGGALPLSPPAPCPISGPGRPRGRRRSPGST